MRIDPKLPHWDMTTVYPGLSSPAFEQDMRSIVESIDALEALWERHDIGSPAPQAAEPGLGSDIVPVFETVVSRYQAVLEATRTLNAYVRSFVATDSSDALAQAKLSELQKHNARLSLLGTRLVAWIGTLDIDALCARSPLGQNHAFWLHKAKIQARHLMPPGEEALAAQLNLSGGTAWAKLHNNVASQLLVPWPDGNERGEIPMSVVRTLAFDLDPSTRRRAYEAELAAWGRARVPLAQALNSIKSEGGTLAARRGWDDPLDVALWDNHIDRPTLEAMFQAARESFPDFRRYLRTKARVLGSESLGWYDLFAPVGESEQTWTWEQAGAFVTAQFGAYSAELGDFARRTLDERWIDAEPRPGKRDGAFCMGLRADESRIALNYKPAWASVSTLAHELGHAYHNLRLARRTPLLRDTPMTLAETASIFCETLIRRAALEAGDKNNRIAILEASLQGTCQVIVDITSRFVFETGVFEARRERELSPDELCERMLQAQRETYGDGLDSDALHPYMWAVKSHYYSASFYNFPYMFGLLFGLGLYARYQKEPDAFKAGYDELLSSTGIADAQTLAARWDIDLHAPDFWRSSLDLIRQDIDHFEALVTA